MDVALYISGHGILLLVPACMHPSRDAERRYGPLSLCGEGHLDDLDDAQCRLRIEADLDRSAYALVHFDVAQSLLGERHPCFANPMFRGRADGLSPRLYRRRHATLRM